MYAHIFRSVCNERGRKVGPSFRWPENECVTQPTIYMTVDSDDEEYMLLLAGGYPVPGQRREARARENDG